jgi:hypothetical protein
LPNKAPYDTELAKRYNQPVLDLQRYSALSLEEAKTTAWQATSEEINAHADSIPARAMDPSQIDELSPR